MPAMKHIVNLWKSWNPFISPLLCLSDSLLANLSLPPNGSRAWGWKTSSPPPTLASVLSTSGPTASGTTTESSSSGRTQCPPYLPQDRRLQRWEQVSSLFLCWKMAFSTWSEQITLHILQIELRKRGVIPKETNASNQMGMLADRDRMRETVMRREKRGGMRVSFFWFWFIHL